MYRKIITLVIISLLFSCAKENNETENQLNQNGSDAKMEIVNAKVYQKYEEALNLQNLNDFAGVIHNDVLDELNTKENKAQLVGLSEDEVIAKIISDVSAKLNQKYANKAVDLGKTPTIAQMKFIRSDAKNFYSNVIEQSTALHSLETQKVSKEFFSTIANLSKEESLDYNRIKSEIENFERRVMENSKLSKEEKDYILQGTSIARNSFYYWGEETVLGEPKDPTVFEKGKKIWGGWKWIVMGLGDVAGYYIGGGLIGAITASKFIYDVFPTTPSGIQYDPIKLIMEFPEKESPQQPKESAPKVTKPEDKGYLIYESYGDKFKVIGRGYNAPWMQDPQKDKSLKELEKDTLGIRKTFDPKISEILKEINNP